MSPSPKRLPYSPKLGGITGVPPAKVVILGAGIVAESAIRAALGLGASIRVLDNNIYKLMRLKSRIGTVLHTSAIHPKYLQHQLETADVVIGAIHSKEGRSPIIITEEMVMRMKKGAVIIDVSIDQGGICETSEVTTLDNPRAQYGLKIPTYGLSGHQQHHHSHTHRHRGRAKPPHQSLPQQTVRHTLY